MDGVTYLSKNVEVAIGDQARHLQDVIRLNVKATHLLQGNMTFKCYTLKRHFLKHIGCSGLALVGGGGGRQACLCFYFSGASDAIQLYT